MKDACCELRDVGLVYSAHNIWANVQQAGGPWAMSWDLGNAAAWRPFFGPLLPPRELATLQVGLRLCQCIRACAGACKGAAGNVCASTCAGCTAG